MTLPSEGEVAAGEGADTGAVLTLSIGHAVHDTYTAFLPPLLPTFIANLGLSNTQAGLLSASMQGPALLQPFIGHLADRVDLRYLVVAAPGLSAAAMSLLGAAPGYWLLAALLVLVGISSAFIHAVGPALAGNLAGRRLGRAMGYWMVGGELGRTLGPLVIVSAVGWLSLRGTPWLMVGGVGASLALALRLRRAPLRPAGGAQALPWRRALRGMGPLLGPLGGIMAARSLMTAALTIYLPTFLSAQGLPIWWAGASLSLLQGSGVAGALLGGSLSDRVGRRAVLAFSLSVTPLLMLAFLALGGWARIALLVALGPVALCAGPVILALVLEGYPENRALANGVQMGMNFLLQMTSVVVLGALADLMGMHRAFVAGALSPLVGLPLILLLPKAQRRRVARPV